MILNKIKINDTDTVTPGVVYDISKATGQSYETLSDALSGNNVPLEIREGGMTVRFVHTGDNIYMQYRCMAQSFTTDVTQWQGVDVTPTPDSHNFVESGDIFSFVSKHKNAMLEVIDANPNGLSIIPYGVVEIGVHDSYSTSGNIYLKRCHYRSVSGRFYFTTTDGEGVNIIDANTDISSLHGLVKLSGGSYGIYELIIDTDWLKSNPVNSMDLSLTAPISVDKLKSTTYSQLIKERDKLNIIGGYKTCNTPSGTQIKNIPVAKANAILVVGSLGKIKMTYANTYVPTDGNPVKLQITYTQEYPLYYNGNPVSDTNTWFAGEVVDCYFDGTNYYLTPLANNSVFNGTDGVSAGTKGLVPAPTTEQADYLLSSNGNWKRNDGYVLKEQVNVNSNAQRIKTYTLKPKTKIAVKVSNVSGTSATYNLHWIKTEGNQSIFTGYPLGYMSDELVVPDDATGIRIFMTPAASGNVNLIEVFDAESALYVSKKLTQNINGFKYLNNRQVVNIQTSVEVSASQVTIFTINECMLKDLSGDLYAYIDGTAKFAIDGVLRFIYTDDTETSILGLNMRQDKLFKLLKDKTLSRVIIYANSIVEAGTLNISLFAIEPSALYMSYPLYGKNIICFGDSNTEFKSGIDSARYSDHLAKYSQANIVNVGIGGTELCQRVDLSLTPSGQQQCIAAFEISSLIEAWATEDYSYQDAAVASGYLGEDYQSRCENKLALLKANHIDDFDIILISGGGNDYGLGATVGNKVWDNYNCRTTAGAINNSIKKLYEANSKLQVYMIGMLPMNYADGFSDDYTPSGAPIGDDNNPMSRYDYNDMLHYMAKLNHIPYLDWYWDCGWNRYNWLEYFNDATNHHYYKGYQYVAKKIYKFLLSK